MWVWQTWSNLSLQKPYCCLEGSAAPILAPVSSLFPVPGERVQIPVEVYNSVFLWSEICWYQISGLWSALFGIAVGINGR